MLTWFFVAKGAAAGPIERLQSSIPAGLGIGRTSILKSWTLAGWQARGWLARVLTELRQRLRALLKDFNHRFLQAWGSAGPQF